MPRPDPSEHAQSYGKYIALVPETEAIPALRSEIARTLALLRETSEAEAGVRHAPYTWSAKEVVGHMIDSERIFAYRALRIARGDKTPLPGFDENAYAKVAQFDRRTLADLTDEFEAVRRSSSLLFESFDEDAMKRRAEANGQEISVRALAFTLVGHERHHANILRKRLGKA